MSLRVENLYKKYDEQLVLKDVSFEAHSGEVFGIFGATAAGKSTLIRLLSGAESCDSGAIFHNSADVTSLSCETRNFHFPKLTNEIFWKNLFQTDSKPQIADGEGQVIALEESLSKADSVLLLDDSFCYMDWLLRADNYSKLRRSVQEKKLVVVVATNDFDEAMLLCDRIAVMVNGEIKQIGTPREIYEMPKHVSVARITGRNNLFEARALPAVAGEPPEFQTLAGDHRLFIRRQTQTAPTEQNASVTLGIRPEQISISFGASFPEDNLLRARITDIRFHGATTLIVLDSNGLRIEALVLRLVGLKIGDECMVGLPPDRILVLKQ